MFTMDFYAYWNADQVAALLRAVVGITSSKGYGLFLACSALLGFLCVTGLCRQEPGRRYGFLVCGRHSLLLHTLRSQSKRYGAGPADRLRTDC